MSGGVIAKGLVVGGSSGLTAGLLLGHAFTGLVAGCLGGLVLVVLDDGHRSRVRRRK